MGWETIFYFYEKWVDRNFAIIAKLWHSENFAGIAKSSLCYSKIHCSPMLDPAATVPLATVLCILHPTSCSLLFFFYFLPALKFFIPGLLKLI